MTLSVSRLTEKMSYSDLFSKLFVGPLNLQWFQINFVADVAPMSTLRYLGVICKFGFEGSLPPTGKILSIVGCEAIYNFASRRLLVNQGLMHWLCLLEAVILKTCSLSMQLFFLGRLKCQLTCLWCFFVLFCFPTNIPKLIRLKECCLFQNNHPFRINVHVL